MSTADRWLPVLHALADAADAVSLPAFRSGPGGIGTKADGTLVTETDRAVERAVRAAAEPAGLAVVGEEYGGETGTGPTLIVDPIDATENFARGVPVFATLLAVEQHGELLAGLVSAPALGARWHAARGAGAWRGGTRLAVSAVATLAEATVFHGGIHAGTLPLLRAARRTRGFGDFWQHCLVAEGRGEASVDVSVAVWDVAPLYVLVEEAGGVCTDLSGRRDPRGGSLLAANAGIHARALAALAGSGT
jgi:histidinol-phosphatase